MTSEIKPAVKALIERDGKFLALKTETSDSEYWVLPGGKVEYGEKAEEALEREIEEEISCSAEIGETVGMYHFFTGEDNSGDQVVLTAFKASIGEQEIDLSDNPADEKITEFEWLEADEFMEKTENKSLRELIRDYAYDTPKLVRDKIPQIIEDAGKTAEVYKAEGQEYRDFLAKKLVEESREFYESRDKSELGDVLDVVKVYRHVENIDESELKGLRAEKTKSNGSFLKGFILEDLE